MLWASVEATKAWMKFFGDAGAADDLASFEHERFQSRFREIERGDQAIVAGADDDDVVSCWHAKKTQMALWF